MGNRSSSTYKVQNEEKKNITSKQSVKKRPSTKRDVGNAQHDAMKEEAKKHIQEATKHNEPGIANDTVAVQNDVKFEKPEKVIVTTNECVRSNPDGKAVQEEFKDSDQSNHTTQQTKEVITVEGNKDLEQKKTEIANQEEPPKMQSFKIEVSEESTNKLKNLPIEENASNASLERIVTTKQETSATEVNADQKETSNTEVQTNITESIQTSDITGEIYNEISKSKNEDKHRDDLEETKDSCNFKIEDNPEAQQNEISNAEDLNKIEIYKNEETHVKRTEFAEKQNKEETKTDVNKNDVKFDVEVYTYKEDNKEKVIEIEDTTTSTTSNKILEDEPVDTQLRIVPKGSEKEEVTQIENNTTNVTSDKLLQGKSVENEREENTKAAEIENNTSTTISTEEDNSVNIHLKNERAENKKEDPADTKEDTNESSQKEHPTDTKTATSMDLGEKSLDHADNATGSEEKQIDSLSTIHTLEDEIKIYKEQVVLFAGTSKDKQYLHLKEMLVRCIIKLDDIIVGDSDKVRNERKRVIKSAQDGLDTLERNVVKTNASSDDDDDDSDIEKK